MEQCWHRVPGGVGRATARTAAALAADPGWEVVGVAARHRSRARLEPPVPVVQHRLPRPLLYRSWHRLGRPRPSGVTGPVDVVWAAAMAMPGDEVPVVATVHDLAFLDHPEWSTSRGLQFFRRSWALTRERAAVVVVPSVTTAAECARHGLAPDRVVVVPWGVDAQPVEEPEVRAVQAWLGLPDRFVLWVGTAEPRKNLPTLVAAMTELDLPLVVVGPAGWLVHPDEVLAPLGDRVHVLGELADQALRAVYAAATVFAFPSLAEGFGLPVVEAMAQGVPVVTSAGTATAEIAGEAGLLVDPRDATALADAIAAVASDDGRRAAMGALGARRAARFTWDATADGYRRAFLRAVAERAR